MSKRKTLSIEVIHKEIDLIQNCIDRMSKNSFACKGWNLTLIAGVTALFTEEINRIYLIIIVMCINLCFWWLDSFYVLQEKKYREKYCWVIKNRKEGNEEWLYDLNPNNKYTVSNDQFNESQISVAFTRTLMPMYGGITLLSILAMGSIICKCWR